MTKPCLTTEEFIRRSKEVHGDRYDYSLTNYTKAKNRVTIICRKHGDFIQIPHEHLKGSNCKRCSATNWSEDKFIKAATKKHNGFYTYEDSKFTIRDSDVFVTCPIHGRFKMSAHNHLKGRGCSECSKRTWTGQSKESYLNKCSKKYNGKAFLYLVKILTKSDDVYKIGISATGVESRFSNERRYIEDVIKEVLLDASHAWDIEKIILNEFSEYISNEKYLRRGNTECLKNPNIDKLCYSIDYHVNRLKK